MIDITGISIRGLCVHRVGNQLRNEGVVCSNSQHEISSHDKLPLVQFLFGHADRLNLFTFTHSVDTTLNAIAQLSSAVGDETAPLKKASRDIAAHLYSVSNHPRIKAGNVFVGIFEGIRFNGRFQNVLGIFKSDAVDEFIKVDVAHGSASLVVEEGAALTSLDKIALVFLPDKGKPTQVLSACARGEEAVFWNERFLQIQTAQSAKADTKACLNLCLTFAKSGDDQPHDPDKLVFLNRSLQYFETAEKFSEEAFATVFTNEAQEKEFLQFKNAQKDEGKLGISNSFKIERDVVRKERRRFQKNVKLDANIEIRLRFNNQADMKKRVELGFDKSKGMAFYKLYY